MTSSSGARVRRFLRTSPGPPSGRDKHHDRPPASHGDRRTSHGNRRTSTRDDKGDRRSALRSPQVDVLVLDGPIHLASGLVDPRRLGRAARYNLTHAARSDLGTDFIGAEASAGSESSLRSTVLPSRVGNNSRLCRASCPRVVERSAGQVQASATKSACLSHPRDTASVLLDRKPRW